MWHVNPQTQAIGKCRATVQACPFGEAQHFSSSENAYESIYEAIPSLRKNAEEYRELEGSLKRHVTIGVGLSKSRYDEARATAAKKFDYTQSVLKALGVLAPASLSILLPPPVTVIVGAAGVVAAAGLVASDIRDDRKEKALSRELVASVDEKRAKLKKLVNDFTAEAKLSRYDAEQLLRFM